MSDDLNPSLATEDDFRTIAVVYSLPEAAILASTLRANGIPAYAANYATLCANTNWIVALGGVEIRVWSGAIGEAKSLLEPTKNWSPPPRSYFRNSIFNAAIAIALCVFCGVAPPPRARGVYLWTSAEAEVR